MFLRLWAFGAGLSLLVILVLSAFFANATWQVSGGETRAVLAVAVVMVLASAGTLSVATGLAWLVTRRLARPLEWLSAAARSMTADPLHRAPALPAGGYREARDLARALNVMAEELAREEAGRRQFLAAVAHELRTPLTYLQGYARSLLDGVVTDEEEVRQHLAVIDREARRLGRLVGDLLDLEALSSGRFSLRTGPVDPGALAAEALHDIAPAARQHGIRLDLELEPGVPVLGADRDRLRQALWNLLDNALRHTGPGGRVWIEVRRAGGDVLVTVHDTGTGFDPADAQRIWEPFYRGDGTRCRGRGGDGRRGYGLGLAMVRRIVEAHGGRVHADGRPGQGASVGFRLPITPAQPADPAEERNPRAGPGTAGGPAQAPPLPAPGPAPGARPAGRAGAGEGLVATALVAMGLLALAAAVQPALLFQLMSDRGGPAAMLVFAATGAVSTVLLAGVIALVYRAWTGGDGR